ncbi:MAG: phage minor capsid protein, partial [Ruminococcus sp.]|nr:phage minor capsid protein [Ruminococcus sp.]
MYSASELERASMALDEPTKALETRIMTDIVRRIRDNGEITAAADWQITRLIQLGMAMEEISAAINEALGAAENITDSLFANVIEAGYVRDKGLYEAIGKVQIPFEDNEPLQQLISSVTAQTNETMHNITQSLGFAQRGTDGHISFTPIADYYQQTLDNAMLDISSGAFDYNTVLKRTVKEMTDSGLRTVDYATGWSNRVDVAARRAVMTGMNQLTAKKNEQDAEELQTDWFEISWHSGARPSHWWGGRQYTKEQLTTVCNLGDVTGLCGANCYHNFHPFIPGISIPVYDEEKLEELNRQEKEPVEYCGKKYTKYEALQRQRRLETTMRAQRQEMQLLKEGGADED